MGTYLLLFSIFSLFIFPLRPKRMTTISQSFFFIILPFLLCLKLDITSSESSCGPIVADDADRIQFALNLEFLEAEFFLIGATGVGLDQVAPKLAQGGPPPIGARKANLGHIERRIIEEFGYQEVGHLRAIISAVGGLRRPQYDLSPKNFANIFNKAAGITLEPPLDPYANTVNYLLASYAIPYVGLVGYVAALPALTKPASRGLVASLLGVESGQDAVIRALLYKRGRELVKPYNITVAEFTRGISNLRDQLGLCGVKDEGIIVVDLHLGAENKTRSNILSADASSLSYARQPQEILRIVYGTGKESQPGGFLPDGGIGNIARRYLK